MPSASKKRKAAKKKKEKVADINPSSDSHAQGSDDLKSQDEKGSDGGEVSSSANHDHNDHYQSVNEGSEQVEERDPSAAQPSVAVMKSMEEVTDDIRSAEEVERKEDSVVIIERQLKSEESSDSKNVNVEYTGSAEESHYGNENSSGNSKDESLSETNSKDEPNNSIQGAMTSEYLAKSGDSSLAQMTLVTENSPVKETGNSVNAVSSVSEVKSGHTGNDLLEQSVVAQVGAADLAMKRNDDKLYLFSDENVRTSSLEEPKPKECDSKAPISSSGSPFTTNGQEHIKDSESPECSENQPLVASAPPLVKKTSWLSCCGLFEVLSGSNR